MIGICWESKGIVIKKFQRPKKNGTTTKKSKDFSKQNLSKKTFN